MKEKLRIEAMQEAKINESGANNVHYNIVLDPSIILFVCTSHTVLIFGGRKLSEVVG